MGANSTQQQWALAIAEAELKFNEIAVADGSLVTYQREASFAMQAVMNSDYLQKCSHDSIRNAVVNVANVGLSLSPTLKLAYLVPRDGKACLDISYIGLVKIATDSGSVSAAHATVVRANDNFEYIDAFTMPRHKFDPFATVEDRGDIVGVYAVAKFSNGITQIETMSLAEVEKIRSKSKAKDSPAWRDWFEEMARKSVVKRASKMWPRTERLSKAVQILDQHEGAEHINTIEHEPEVNIDEMRDALAAAQNRLKRLLASVEAAPDTAALEHIWKEGVKELRAVKDKESYGVLKAAVNAKGIALKTPQQEAA